MKLSIGMIVKNESKYLRQCLTALKPIMDNVESELIIVDTGSTDSTVKIAKEFTDKIFFHKWNDDFAESRNITIDKSKGEWYFYIDADEILENPQEIINFFLSDNCEKYQAFAIKVENLIDENRNSIGEVFYSRRIVKRDNTTKFTGRIHEYLPEKSPVFMSESILVHYGYIKTDKRLVMYKYKRNINILNKEIENEPDNIVWLYHLAKTHNFQGDYFEGLRSIERALQVASSKNIFHIWIYNLAIDTYNKNELYHEAEDIALMILKKVKQETTAHIITYFYLAQAQSMLRKNSEAIYNYIKCLKLLELEACDSLPIDLNSSAIDFGGNKFIYWQIAILYDRLLDFDSSYEWASKVLDLFEEEKDYNGIGQIVKYISKLCLKYKKYYYLVQLYQDSFRTDFEEMGCNKADIIINEIEENILVSFNSKEAIIESFYKLDVDSDYVFLNQIRRKMIKNEELNFEDIERIKKFNFNNNLGFYGELIYYMIKQNKDIDNIIGNLSESQINKYISHMNNTFTDLSKTLLDYFRDKEDIKNLNYSISSKTLKRVVLIKEKKLDDNYKNLFTRYIKEGIFYMEEVYKKEILDFENTYVLKNNEEMFFMYMKKAYQYKQEEQLKYIYYLRQALNAYEYMDKGIRLLLEEMQEPKNKDNNISNDNQNEFEEYKNMLKKNIKILLETNKTGEAKYLIDEYLKIVPDDLEMLILKSDVQLLMM